MRPHPICPDRSEFSCAGVQIRLTEHALDRLVARVKPGLDAHGARADLARLIPHGEIVADPPTWFRTTRPDRAFLVIGDVLFPLAPTRTGTCATAITCVPRGTLGDGDRNARNERRRRRQLRHEDARGRRPELHRQARRAAVQEAIGSSVESEEGSL
jgi:hypothetical protein